MKMISQDDRRRIMEAVERTRGMGGDGSDVHVLAEDFVHLHEAATLLLEWVDPDTIVTFHMVGEASKLATRDLELRDEREAREACEHELGDIEADHQGVPSVYGDRSATPIHWRVFDLSFAALRLASDQRQLRWRGGELLIGRLLAKHQLLAPMPMDGSFIQDVEDIVGRLWAANEAAGEMGEACNAVKKLVRETMGLAVGDVSTSTVDALAEELADVVICVDMLASRYGIALGGAVRTKFNATSSKAGIAVELQMRNTVFVDGRKMML